MAWQIKRSNGSGGCQCGCDTCTPLQFKVARAYKSRLVGLEPLAEGDGDQYRYLTGTYAESCALECGYGITSYFCPSTTAPCDYKPCEEDCCNEGPLTSVKSVDRFRGCSAETGTCIQGSSPLNSCTEDDSTPTHYASHCDDGFLECCADGTSEITLSDPYTFDMLETDIADMYGSVDWATSFLDWNITGDVIGLEEGNFIFSSEIGGDFAAHYYIDDGDEPEWIDKAWMRLKNPTGATIKYAPVFHPVGGGSSIGAVAELAAGAEVTIEPPAEPGYITISTAVAVPGTDPVEYTYTENGGDICLCDLDVATACTETTKTTLASEVDASCGFCSYKADDNGIRTKFATQTIVGDATFDVPSYIDYTNSYDPPTTARMNWYSLGTGHIEYTQSCGVDATVSGTETIHYTFDGIDGGTSGDGPEVADISQTFIVDEFGTVSLQCDHNIWTQDGSTIDYGTDPDIGPYCGDVSDSGPLSGAASGPKGSQLSLANAAAHHCDGESGGSGNVTLCDDPDGTDTSNYSSISDAHYEATANSLTTGWTSTGQSKFLVECEGYNFDGSYYIAQVYIADYTQISNYVTTLSKPLDEKPDSGDDETSDVCGDLCSSYQSFNATLSTDALSTIVSKEVTLSVAMSGTACPSPELYASMEVTLLWFEVQTPSDCRNAIVATLQTSVHTVTSIGSPGSRVWNAIPDATVSLNAKTQMGENGTFCILYPVAAITDKTLR